MFHKVRTIGFEDDLMNEIARRLHLRPLFVNTRWEVILQQMQDGRYDCIVGGITITPARQQILAWSDPYMTPRSAWWSTAPEHRKFATSLT